jgi:hypothetical protein
MADNNHKSYLGDGVYIALRECDAVLTTEDGFDANNTIYLESAVIGNMMEWLRRAGFIKEYRL